MEVLDVLKPETLTEVKSLFTEYQNCKILAGGTDLLLDIKNGKQSPQYLIDLGNIKALKKIEKVRKDIVIGSMVSFKTLSEAKIIKQYFNSLYHSAKGMGSPQIRNLATIGGNIINGAPAADITPCLISLDATLVIESAEYERFISCEQYFIDYDKEKVRENEVLTKIIIPKKKRLTGFYKLGKRNSLAIARVNTAISIEVKQNKIKRFAVCLGAVGRYPFRVLELEKMVVGKSLDYLLADEVLEKLENAVFASIKTRKTMPFKKEAIKGVFKKALENAYGEVIL
jgi:CO/xanthine dehydrogenase FAD-binding subunit